MQNLLDDLNDLKSYCFSRRLSARIRNACQQGEFYTLLSNGRFGAFDGGCLMVAVALQKVMGIDQIASVYGTNGSTPRIAHQHVVVPYGSLFLDGDGLSTYQQLLERWQKEIPNGVLTITPWDHAGIILEESCILYDAQVVRKLVGYFYKALTK